MNQRRALLMALLVVSVVYGVGSIAMLAICVAYDAPTDVWVVFGGLLCVCIVAAPALAQLLELERRKA